MAEPQVCKFGDIVLYSGVIGQHCWENNPKKDRFNLILNYILNYKNKYSYDGLTHTIYEVELMYSTKTNLDSIQESTLSEYEKEIVNSREYRKMLESVLLNHYGKEYSLDKIVFISKSGDIHDTDSMDGPFYPKDEEPEAKQESDELLHKCFHIDDAFGFKKLVKDLHGVKVYMMY